MEVSLISITPDAEKTMAHIARVSNPNNQDNPNYSGLLKYCIKHNHWSVFEQSTMTLQIDTTRAIAAQILRHRSFTFQEFSQRYAESNELGSIELPDLRRQDKKTLVYSYKDLHDRILSIMDSLYQSKVCTRNTEGTHGDCGSMPKGIYRTVSCCLRSP